MTSKELYRRFIGLCEKWPKDELKTGRDYGAYFRDIMMKQFTHGEQSSVENPRDFNLRLAALERIANNTYYKEDPLKRSSATGLETWACTEAISNESMIKLRKYDEDTVLNRLKESLKISFKLMNQKHREAEEKKTA